VIHDLRHTLKHTFPQP